MNGVYMTCMEMFGNGAKITGTIAISMKILMKKLLPTAQLGYTSKLMEMSLESYEAVHGAAFRNSAAQPHAVTFLPTMLVSFSVFVSVVCRVMSKSKPHDWTS